MAREEESAELLESTFESLAAHRDRHCRTWSRHGRQTALTPDLLSFDFHETPLQDEP